jgi:thiamine-phosphate pyrophosphorylase
LKRLVLPRLYVILDAALLTVPETECAEKLADAGVRLLQYRNKRASARELFESSKRLSALLIPQVVTFVVNNRADVASAAEASGVHVGQDDLGVEAARSVIGVGKLLGVSTHNFEQFKDAAATSADYVAVGPVFSTSTKANPDPVIGIEFIRQIRSLTDKPIVAIGGITLERAAEVIHAGADSVAVISDILLAPDPGRRARQYIELLGTANHAAAV